MVRHTLSLLTLALQTAVVFLAYFFAAHYALLLNPFRDFAVFFWPAAGIGLTATFFLGHRLIPAILAGAFLANYAHGAPLLVALVIAIGNSLEAAAGGYLLRRTGFDPLFKRLKDALVFTAVALLTGLSAAIVGTGALAVAHLISDVGFPLTLLVWWIGDTLGMLVAGAFFLRWIARPIQFQERSIADIFENVVFFFALSCVVVIIFLDPIADLHNTPLLYLTFVPLTWGSLRIGPRAMTLAIVLIASIAVGGTLMHFGPFETISLSDIFLLQAYLGTVAIISLLFVSTVEERKDAMKSVRKHIAELQEDVEDLSSADRAKNEFIAILSHELRNPLAPVLSSLELMRMKGTSDATLDTMVDTTYSQVQRMARLLDDLLDITRVARKHFNLQREHVELREIIEHSVMTVDPLMRKRNHALDVSYPESPIWLDADRLRLEQVFVNLLNNAAKYTESGGRITVTAKSRDGKAEVRVRDNGIGIPKEMLGAIFEPFRQINPSSKTGGGLGIGLSLTKRLIEVHGGAITAESGGTGRGSEFIVTLPILDTAPKPREKHAVIELPAARGAGPPRRPRKKRSILIVDDNEAAAKGFATLLQHFGHDTRLAHDGASALRILGAFSPEVILMDIGLPDEDGYSLARKVREMLSPPPLLVAVTGFGLEEDKERAKAAGFDAHLTKPVSVSGLEGILDKLE